MVERRDILKGIGVAAAAAATVTATEGRRHRPRRLWPLASTLGPRRSEHSRPDERRADPEDYFIPGRFAGKTIIVTGSARGMGEVAARRLAKEGANVVGVDILEDLGAVGDRRHQGRGRQRHLPWRRHRRKCGLRAMVRWPSPPMAGWMAPSTTRA
jgi:hypothetical protein